MTFCSGARSEAAPSTKLHADLDHLKFAFADLSEFAA